MNDPLARKWQEVEDRLKKLIERYRTLKDECRQLQEKCALLEVELQAVRELRADRDRLKTEREVVRRKVLEMLQQLEKVAL